MSTLSLLHGCMCILRVGVTQKKLDVQHKHTLKQQQGRSDAHSCRHAVTHTHTSSVYHGKKQNKEAVRCMLYNMVRHRFKPRGAQGQK